MPSGSDDRLEDLLNEYREGNVDAFEEFFRKTKKIVYAYVRRRISNVEIAQDLTQDIYLRVHKYILSFDGRKGSALGWLRSIAHNTVTDYLTQQMAKHSVSDPEALTPEQSHIDVNDRIFFEELIYQFRGHIPPEDLTLLLDRVIEEISFEDIGRKHGIRADHARQKFSRILKKLKSVLS